MKTNKMKVKTYKIKTVMMNKIMSVMKTRK